MEEERITEVEIAMAHQQKMLDELNDVVIEQSKDISYLKSQLRLMKESIELASNRIKDMEEETPPPHY